jgi:hypothetical protein
MPCGHASPAARTAFLFVCLFVGPVPCRHALAVLCSVRCARLAALVAVACVCVCLSVAVSEAAADVADPDHAAYFETAKLGPLYRMCTCAPVITIALSPECSQRSLARLLAGPLCLCVGAQLPTGRKPAVGTRCARGSNAPQPLHSAERNPQRNNAHRSAIKDAARAHARTRNAHVAACAGGWLKPAVPTLGMRRSARLQRRLCAVCVGAQHPALRARRARAGHCGARAAHHRYSPLPLRLSFPFS